MSYDNDNKQLLIDKIEKLKRDHLYKYYYYKREYDNSAPYADPESISQIWLKHKVYQYKLTHPALLIVLQLFHSHNRKEGIKDCMVERVVNFLNTHKSNAKECSIKFSEVKKELAKKNSRIQKLIVLMNKLYSLLDKHSKENVRTTIINQAKIRIAALNNIFKKENKIDQALNRKKSKEEPIKESKYFPQTKLYLENKNTKFIIKKPKSLPKQAIKILNEENELQKKKNPIKNNEFKNDILLNNGPISAKKSELTLKIQNKWMKNLDKRSFIKLKQTLTFQELTKNQGLKGITTSSVTKFLNNEPMNKKNCQNIQKSVALMILYLVTTDNYDPHNMIELLSLFLRKCLLMSCLKEKGWVRHTQYYNDYLEEACSIQGKLSYGSSYNKELQQWRLKAEIKNKQKVLELLEKKINDKRILLRLNNNSSRDKLKTEINDMEKVLSQLKKEISASDPQTFSKYLKDNKKSNSNDFNNNLQNTVEVNHLTEDSDEDMSITNSQIVNHIENITRLSRSDIYNGGWFNYRGCKTKQLLNEVKNSVNEDKPKINFSIPH